MKPSKILREYIEKRVRDAYGKETEAEKIYKQARADFEEEVKRANEKIKKYFEEVRAEINNPHNFPISTSTTTPFSTWCYGGELSAVEKASRQAEKDRTSKVLTTIEDILIELELGGTKAQLEERLANLGKEEE